ncbi:autotransporter outer membrane beta-barrel domain-containing protein [Bartonella sp. MR30HLJHH]|uniref:autotransporter outer membrane beta-barrel domain-containing protein n=1 Tax=Bartonella sp. MR30HLJHH TaxID=3243557 RepID=UPI0038577073
MKKSFLLYTVSGILFCSSTSLSYALHDTNAQPTMDLPSRQPAHAENQVGASRTFNPYSNASSSYPLSTSSSTRTIINPPPTKSESTTPTSTSTLPPKTQIEGNLVRNTISSSKQNSDLNQGSTQTSKANVAEGVQSNPIAAQDILTQSPTTEIAPTAGMEVKSRRRSGVPTSSTDSSRKKTSENSAVPSQSEPPQPAPNLRATLINLKPTRAEPTKQTTELSPTPKESELAQPISLRSETGKPALPVPLKSVKSAPVQSASAQKISEKSTQIEDISSGIEAENGKTITLHNKKIQDNGFAVHAEGNNSKVNMIGGTVDAGFVALSVSDGGEIDATGIAVTAEIVGLLNIEGTIKLKDSSVHVTGNHEADGIIFRNNPYNASRKRYTRNAERNANAVQEQDVANIADKVTLENTKIFVEHGRGINLYGTGINGEVSLKNSEIHADILLKNIKNENAFTNTLTLVSNHSSLEGRVRTSKDNRTVFDLKEGTKWLLKANKIAQNNDNVSDDHVQFGVDKKSYSNLSGLHLTDSVIMFDKPMEGHYQALFIGPNLPKGEGTAHTASIYSATGVAEIYVNTQWDKHSPITEQQTDRIVINGDVSGRTVVHINLQETDKKTTDSSAVWGEHMASLPLGTHGISIIQVSGQANENSFTLAGNYMTIGKQPYKYVLTSYKPGTSHESQNLFGKNSNFWDFRLQNAYIDKDKKVRALLPQVANYLTISNTLFSAGFTDVNNQNTLLDNMQTTVFGAEDNKNNGIFFSSYGEKVTLSSNRDPLHYGYGADVNYAALQLGVILAALESKDISTHFGFVGTYGKLAFTPKEMQDSEKTTLDKWSLAAYSSIQHSNGIYVNTLLSYGKLKGNITTALVGNATKLDGTEMLNISATIGQKLATNTKGLVFEPQAQFIYQNLMFDIFSDADGLKVDMGNPHQWLVRIGGRLTKTIMAAEESKAVSFYGKVNVIRASGDGKTIKIADTFHVDPTGSSVEGGMGVNAYLSQNIVLNADISYRQKLQKAGVSGTNLSGGIRYRF